MTAATIRAMTARMVQAAAALSRMPLRLARGRMKAHAHEPSIDELRGERDGNSRIAERLALLILAGLAIDILEAFILRKPWAERLLTIGANAAIFAGVWGELHFDAKSKDASDRIVAAALDRAATAEAALATWRLRRSIPADSMFQIAETLKQFEPLSFDVSLSAADEEYFGLMEHIGLIARWAGWEWVDWPSSDSVRNPGTGAIGIGTTSFNNIVFSYRIDSSPQTIAAVEAFAEGLRNCGLAASARIATVRMIAPASAATVHIAIGRKT